MHTSQRAEIEKEIERQVEEILSPRGFEVEKVMLKNIQLPVGLTKSIEEKLQSEQEAQRMEFVLNKERREAERKQIEAEGIRNYNRTLSEGLNAGILQYQYIDAMRQLSLSTNSKVIFSNGNVQPPVVLQEKQ
jgi:regulator of protease activity HflC (stomatin/prohibitin superfamily)